MTETCPGSEGTAQPNRQRPLSCQKRDLRARYRALREGLSADTVASVSHTTCVRLATWPELQRASLVMAYIAFRNEVDLQDLFRRLPQVRWAVPRLDGKDMRVHPYDPDNLVQHRYGMLEPSPESPEFPISEIDVVLVPGIAFDHTGGRLGFGGGYYDRFLPQTDALRVGITFSECLAEAVPCDSFDQPMDWVVTPSQAYRCNGLRCSQALRRTCRH